MQQSTPVVQASSEAAVAAIRANDIEALRQLLAAGVDPTSGTTTVVSLPALAVTLNHPECLRLLVEAGADINVGGVTQSAVALAFRGLNSECIRIISDCRRADIAGLVGGVPEADDASDVRGAITAIGQSDLDTLRRLCEGPLAAHIRTPHHILSALAVCGQRLPCLQVLVDAGASLLSGGALSIPPLHAAVHMNLLEAVRILLRSGRVDVDAVDGERTPLTIAASEHYADVVGELLRHGASVDLTRGDGSTPLHAAISSERNVDHRFKCVELLVEAGADVNAAVNSSFLTPLHLAVLRGAPDIIDYLIHRGADPNVGDVSQRPATAAVGRGDVECLLRLLNGGARLEDPGQISLAAIAVTQNQPACLAVILTRYQAIDVRTMAVLITLAQDMGRDACIQVLMAHLGNLAVVAADAHAPGTNGAA